MRISSTVISGAVAAVAVAGSANAAFVTWASLATPGSVSKGGVFGPPTWDGWGTAVSSANPESVGSPSGVGGQWAADRYLEATNAGSSMVVASGNATFTGGAGTEFTGNQPGNASMRWDFASAQDLTGIIFRLNLTSVGVGGGELFVKVFSATTMLDSYGLGSITTTGNKDFQFFNNLAGARSVVITWTPAVAAGNSMTLSAIQYNGVPAPGALALLGVAGLVGSRRRRS
jgi:MYXO-CTERM domain-containing protein